VSEAGDSGLAAAASGAGANWPYRVVVLASGNGSNLQALIDKVHGRAAAPGGPTVEIVLVVSDKPGARALERAAQAGIPTETCALASAGTRAAQEATLLGVVRKADPDLVVLAGYMRIVPADFLRAFPWRVINLHPALLPAFPGTTSIKDALEHGAKVTGVTVHFVDEGLDSGPIIAQEAVRIEEGETFDGLAERIHAVEHELLPNTVRLLAAGKVRPPLSGTRVVQVD
jgi:phosphoribosylglycinamide formyltransferase-1